MAKRSLLSRCLS